MAAFLTNPRGWAPGTKMSFAGLKKGTDLASVLLWLNGKSDSPLDLPPPPALETGPEDGSGEEGAVSGSGGSGGRIGAGPVPAASANPSARRCVIGEGG